MKLVNAAAVLIAVLAGSARAETPTTTRPTSHAMVVTANPLATQAGLKVLKAGGSAADAAVAVQAVLGLVEPQSSSLAGGAFMLYYDSKTRKTVVYNGRETAPAGAAPEMFEGPDGKPLGHFVGVLSGRSTGVIGAMAMFAQAHKDHGKLPWRDLFGDGERLADQGFAISPRMGSEVAFFIKFAKTPDAVAYFTKPDGTLYQIGETFKNPAYAATLRRLAKEGPSALYAGEIAKVKK